MRLQTDATSPLSMRRRRSGNNEGLSLGLTPRCCEWDVPVKVSERETSVNVEQARTHNPVGASDVQSFAPFAVPHGIHPHESHSLNTLLSLDSDSHATVS